MRSAWRTDFRRLLPRAAAAALAVALAGCGEKPAPAPGAAPAPKVTAWPMTRGGSALSGSAAAPVPRHPGVAWTFTAPGPVNAEAAIVDGRVFIGSDKGLLHCLEAASGRELWSFETKDAVNAAPAVGGGRVFLSSNDGKLYALAADTGAVVWTFATDEKISSGATLVRNPAGPGDWVLVNGYDGTTRALDAADGRVIWSYGTGNYINGAPAVVDGRFVVFGGCDAQLHVVGLADGQVVRTIDAEAYVPASVGTFGPMAYCGNYANQAVAFDVAAGTVAWKYQDRAMPFFSSPAVNERLVLIGSRDKSLHAIDRVKGEAAWKFRTGGRVEGAPILFEDAVVFGSADGRLYAAELAAGAELWRLELGEALTASPAFGGGLIVIGGEKGSVFAVRAGPAPAPAR